MWRWRTSSKDRFGSTTVVLAILHTEPPIASIAWTKEDAKNAGLPVEVLSWGGSTFTDDDFTTIERERMANARRLL
jgi:hypothetical protein